MVSAPVTAGRDQAAEVRGLAAELAALTTRPWTLMEVCGGQTHAIVRWGLDQLLPSGLRLIHGPGCPVCVTPADTIDRALESGPPSGSDPLLLRRHAAGARQQRRG